MNSADSEHVMEYLKYTKFSCAYIDIGIKHLRHFLTLGSSMSKQAALCDPKFKEWCDWHDSELVSDITTKCDEYSTAHATIDEKLSAQNLDTDQLKQIYYNDIRELISRINTTIRELTTTYLSQIDLISEDFNTDELPTWVTDFITSVTLSDHRLKFYNCYFTNQL